MTKRIMVHIGPPKTGSSAIQKWLNENKGLLLANGYFYPSHTMDENGISSGNFRTILDVSSDRKSSFNRKRFEALLDEFLQSSSHTLLLSSEYFIGHVQNILEVTKNVLFIAYVRPPIEFVESIYNQSIKRHGQTDIIALRNKLAAGAIDKIITLHNEFGGEHFKLRAYSETAGFYKSIIHDFCEAIEFDVPANTISKDERVNRSYSFEVLEFKRWLNRYVGKKYDSELDPLLQKYDGGIKQFSLIPKNLFEEYREQSISHIQKNFIKVNLANKNHLIKHIGAMDRKRYCHQELNKQQFIKMVSYLKNSDYILYIKLCAEVARSISVDNQNQQFVQLLMQGYLTSKQLFSFSKIRAGDHTFKTWFYCLCRNILK
jgi:hypothetical protein